MKVVLMVLQHLVAAHVQVVGSAATWLRDATGVFWRSLLAASTTCRGEAISPCLHHILI